MPVLPTLMASVAKNQVRSMKYIASFEPEVQAHPAEGPHHCARACCWYCRSDQLPHAYALKQNGMLVYFAAFKSHIGFYPPIKGDLKLEQEAAVYAGKGSALPNGQAHSLQVDRRPRKLRAKQDAASVIAERRKARNGDGNSGARET